MNGGMSFASALIKRIKSQSNDTLMMRYPPLTPYDSLWHVDHEGKIYPQHLTEGFFLSFLCEFRDCTHNMEAKFFGKCCITGGKLSIHVSVSQALGSVKAD